MEIENLCKDIRNRAFERKDPKTPEQVGASWYNDDLTYDGVSKTLFIILPTPGCAWALGDSGGCSMCSYVSDCTLEPIDSDTIISIFNNHLFRYDIESEDRIAVKLFASGSFLNPYELPKDARDEILTTLANMDNVAEIIVESRPEYVKEEYLDEIFDIIGDRLFEVSIGLETSNDHTRLNKINKGFNTTDINKEFCLLYGEVSEAYDAWRKKKEDLNEELADIAIYLLGLSEMLGFDLENEIEKKVLKNEKRVYKNLDGVNVRVSE